MEDRHRWRRVQASRSRERDKEERWQWRSDPRKKDRRKDRTPPPPPLPRKRENRGQDTEPPRRKRQREISPWLARSCRLDSPNGGSDAPNGVRATSPDKHRSGSRSLPRDENPGGIVLRTRSEHAERVHKRRKRRPKLDEDAEEQPNDSRNEVKLKRRGSRQENGENEAEDTAKPLGYGSSKSKDEKEPVKPPKKKPMGFGYGASKLVAQGEASESGSEYTSDDNSSDEDSSDDAESAKEKGQGDKKEGKEAPSPASPCPSQASSSKESENSKESSADEEQSDAPESAAECESSQVTASQGWIANVDGETVRPRSKAAVRRSPPDGANADSNEVVSKPGDDELDMPAVDPYIDPYMDAIAENQAIAPDTCDTKDPADASLAASSGFVEKAVTDTLADHEGQAASSTAVVDPYLLDTDPGINGTSLNEATAPTTTKASKRSRWKRRVPWEPPPRVLLPESHDVVFGYDLLRSTSTPESKARRARRAEAAKDVVTAPSNELESEKVSGYLTKCQNLMEALEAGKPINTTVRTFWSKLDAAERQRFSREFPEIAQYAK